MFDIIIKRKILLKQGVCNHSIKTLMILFSIIILLFFDYLFYLWLRKLLFKYIS